MESYFIKCNCQGIFSPSYIKCDECLKLENVFMDYPLINNTSKMPSGIFGLYHTPGNLDTDYTVINKNIHVNNPNFVKFKTSSGLRDDFKITTDILYFHQCNNQIISVSEILHPLKNQTCEDVLKHIVSFYEHHEKEKFLHGSPDISYISVNSDGDYRISVSDFSSAELNDKRYIFGFPGIYTKKLYNTRGGKFTINNLWSYHRRNYHYRSAMLEIHCFMASLELSTLPRGPKWKALINEVFGDNYLGDNPAFSNFYFNIAKASLDERIFDIIHDSL